MTDAKIKTIFERHRPRLGLEFTADTLKIAFLHNSSGREEVRYIESISIKGVADAAIAETLLGALKDIAGKVQDVCLVINASEAITKTIQIPSLDDAEIRDILNLQAGRQTPYSREELIVDYIKLGVYQNVYTKVLVAMAQSSVVKSRIMILEAARLRVTKIVFSADGLGALMARISSPDDKNPTMAILNVDIESSDFHVYNSKGIVFTRNIPVGARLLSLEKDKAVSRFAEEIKKSVEAYQADDIAQNPGILYIAKNCGDASGLMNDLSKSVTLTMRALAPTEFFIIPPEYIEFMKKEEVPSFIGLLSSVSIMEKLCISLIPEEVKLQRKFEEKARRIITAGVLFMVIFFQVCLLLISKMYSKERYLTELKNSFKEKIEEADRLRSMSEKARTSINYLTGRAKAVDVITHLYEILPEEIYLKGVTLDNEGKLMIKGTSKSMSRIFAFVTELENDPLFTGVKTEFTESRKEGVEDVSDFGISMNVERE